MTFLFYEKSYYIQINFLFEVVFFIIGKMIQLQVHLQLPCYDFCFLY